MAKIWLEPLGVAHAGRLKPIELQEIRRIVHENRDFLLCAWEKEQRRRDNR